VRRLLTLAASAALAGCIQYADLPTEPGEPAQGTEPAWLYLSLTAPAGIDSFAISGSLSTGRDPSGRIREAVDPAVRVGHAVFRPEQGSGGHFFYSGTAPRAFAGEPLVVRFPEVAGIAEHPRDLRIDPAVRLDPPTVVLPDTGGLVLRMHGPATSEPTRVTWSAIFYSEAGSLVLNRAGPLPDALRIPREVLPGGGDHPVRATVHYELWIESTWGDPEPAYGVLVRFAAALHWTVLADAAP
jgi:hypothetical protein